DHPRDRELLEHLQAARARAGWGSLESRVKYFLEIMLGLSVPVCDPLSLRDCGLTQWPPRLVETIRTLPARHDKGKKKQASAILFPDDRGRILPFRLRPEKPEADQKEEG